MFLLAAPPILGNDRNVGWGSPDFPLPETLETVGRSRTLCNVCGFCAVIVTQGSKSAPAESSEKRLLLLLSTTFPRWWRGYLRGSGALCNI